MFQVVFRCGSRRALCLSAFVCLELVTSEAATNLSLLGSLDGIRDIRCFLRRAFRSIISKTASKARHPIPNQIYEFAVPNQESAHPLAVSIKESQLDNHVTTASLGYWHWQQGSDDRNCRFGQGITPRRSASPTRKRVNGRGAPGVLSENYMRRMVETSLEAVAVSTENLSANVMLSLRRKRFIVRGLCPKFL